MITAAAHRRHLARFNPAVVVDVDQHFVIGDSIASAVGGDLGPVARTADAGVSWVFFSDNDSAATVATMATAHATVGDYSPFPIIAQRIFDLTGRRSVWHLCSKGNTCLVKDATVFGHWDMAHPTDADNMLQKIDGTNIRSTIMPMSLGLRSRCVRWRIGKSFLHVALGKTDAVALSAATITEGQFSQGLVDLLAYYRANFGVSKLFLWTSGRLGNTAAAVALNQADTDMVGIRAAQLAAQALSPDIHVTFAHTHELGSPENTLTVDGNGQWVSGFQLNSDEAHYTQASYDCIAETTAPIVAARILETL